MKIKLKSDSECRQVVSTYSIDGSWTGREPDGSRRYLHSGLFGLEIILYFRFSGPEVSSRFQFV